MSRTAWSVSVALVLVVLSLAGALTRRILLGPDIDGPRSSNAWRVTLVVTGQLPAGEITLRTPIPLDFRHQHVEYDVDDFQSKELITRAGKGRLGGGPDIVWQRSGLDLGAVQPFRAVSLFRCYLGMHQPTKGMKEATHELDAVVRKGPLLQATARIERDDPDINKLARQLAEQVASDLPRDLVVAFYDHVRDLENEPFLGLKTARDCLRNGGGDSGAKSRLLVALCRNRGIPARVLGGLILTADQEPRLHHWVEAHVDDQWLPMCPTNRYFGVSHWPHNYLILQLDDEPLVHSRDPLQFGFLVQDLSHPREEDAGETHSRLWQRLSLHGLRPAEQHLARFLLLLPLAALIVSIFRIVIGVPTFGTFTPALLGLAFIDLKSLPVGLPIFVMLILVGWMIRHGLDRFHLLQVSRASALLTLIVMLLLALIVAASQLGLGATQYVSLFPMVILTHMVERFWTVESEDGSLSSFRTLFGTMVVAVTVSLCLAPSLVATWMFRYPELLGVVLALHLLLGRYTGYRLSELYRFGDLIGRAEGKDNETRRQGDKETRRQGDKENGEAVAQKNVGVTAQAPGGEKETPIVSAQSGTAPAEAS